MDHSQRNSNRRGILALLVVAGVIAIPVAWQVRENNPPDPYYRSGVMSSTKQLATAHIIYAGESDERFALAEYWSDLIKPYSTGQHLFKVSTRYRPPNWYFWGFPTALGARAIPTVSNPEVTVLIYESKSGVWNAHGGVDNQAPPRRFAQRGAINPFGFVNGRAAFVSPEQVAKGTATAPIWP